MIRQYMPKIFDGFLKNPPAPPSYIINVRSLKAKHDFHKFWIFFIILAAHMPTFIPEEAI